MAALVDFKAAHEAASLPIGVTIAISVEIGAAAEIEIADEHPAEMADVADVVRAHAQCAEKFDDAHDEDKDPHGNGHGKRNQQDALMREKQSGGEENSENRAGSADGGNERGARGVWVHNYFDDYVDQARADTADEIINIKAFGAPGAFDVAAEHPEHEHVDEQVPDAVVQK